MNSLRVLQLSSSSQPSIRRITAGVNQTAMRVLFSVFFSSVMEKSPILVVRHSAKACHTGLFCLSDHLTAEKRRARFTLLDHRKSPAPRGFVAGRRSLATTSLYLAQNRTGRKPFDHPGEGRAQTRTSGPKRRGYHPVGPTPRLLFQKRTQRPTRANSGYQPSRVQKQKAEAAQCAVSALFC